MKRRPKNRRRPTPPDQRRGVLLLVVLSMLVLFLLVGTTFLVTSGQYRTAAKVVEKANRATYQPADLLERALMQVVRDTNNTNSAIRYHSLLRDLYGIDGFVGRVYAGSFVRRHVGFNVGEEDVLAGPRYAGVDPTQSTAPDNNLGTTAGQVVELYVRDIVDLRFELIPDIPAPGVQAENVVGLDFDENGLPLEHQLSATDGYYEGCLLTVLDGPLRGQSVRIVDYDHLRTVRDTRGTVNDQSDDLITVEARIRIMAPSRVDGQPLRFGKLFLPNPIPGGNPIETDQTVLTDFIESIGQGHRIQVNGRPYNGAGVGYNVLAMAHDLANTVDEAPRMSALELVPMDAGGAINYGLELALVPNPVTYTETANVVLNPASGVDPWNRPGTVGGFYAGADFLPLTRNFVGSGNASYDPATSPLHKTFAGPGDTDESYDAADYQNMFLALQALEPRARGRLVGADGVAADPDAYYAAGGGAPSYISLDGVTIPSFHRPALANFWFHRLYNSQWLRAAIGNANQRVRAILEPYDANGAAQNGLNQRQADQIAAIKRKFMMRPLRDDHPSFDGSNPLARYGTTRLRDVLDNNPLVNSRDEITFPAWEVVGPWDVDNDGDGVNDSVWVDIGLPVQQTEDGRFYKPLVAMLVEDLDGRLNLNAHGSAEHLAQEDLDRSQTIAPNADWNANLAQDYVNSRPLFTSNQLPPGSGWGPADISLRPVLSPSLPVDEAIGGGAFVNDTQYDDYARLLRGRPDPAAAGRNVNAAADVSTTWGRYGSSVETGVLGRSLDEPGATYDDASPSVRDPLTPLEFLGYQDFLTFNARSGFSTPGDLRGRFATGLSPLGSSVNEPTDAWRGDVAGFPDDSPYELNLAAETRRDAPTNAEAVRLSYDPDGNGVVDAGTIPAPDDSPYSPAELERVLRALDADADTLPDRLWKVVDAFDPDKLVVATEVANRVRTAGNPDNVVFNPSSLETIVASSRAAINRRLVTTDSYDLPSPNENWTARLIVGADGLAGVPYTDVNLTGLRDVGDTGDDDGDGLFDEGDEAVVVFDSSGSHTFAGGSSRTYDQLWLDGCDDYVVVMRDDPPSPARITDYLRYRVVLELKRAGRVNVVTPHTDQALTAAVTRILYGDDTLAANDDQDNNGAVDRRELLYSFGGLLAPELLAGRRMDLNRPWGDGRDNNGNGVVDEPQEAGEPFIDDNGDGVHQGSELFLDRNRNGAYDPPLDFVWVDANRDGVVDAGERLPFNYTRGADVNGRGATAGAATVRDDAHLARQLYARHLYCLMLLLMDENYLAPYDSNDPQARHYLDPLSGEWNNGPSAQSSMAYRIAAELGGLLLNGDASNRVDPATLNPAIPAQAAVLTEAKQRAQAKLTRRAVAQWAVNVVDFRDADAIQTPFEYDENPWDGWNVVDTQGADAQVLPIDGDLATNENHGQRRNVTAGGFGQPTPASNSVAADTVLRLERTRGVVWGAERPELIMTEGLAWHDRRLEDLVLETNAEGNPADGGQLAADGDDDLDQLRKPKGSTFLELLNPWSGDDQRPAEFYSHVDRAGNVTQNLAGVRLDRLSNFPFNLNDDAGTPLVDDGPTNTRSPVWRFVCVEDHPALRNSSLPIELDTLISTRFADLPGAQRQALLAAIGVLRAVSDDPVTPLSDTTGGVEQYLDYDLVGSPWAYPAVDWPDSGTTGVQFGNDGTFRVPMLPQSDLDYWFSKITEAFLAIATTLGNVGQGVADSDGVVAAVGLIEAATPIPDTIWPEFDRYAQPTYDGGGWTFTSSSRVDGTSDRQETVGTPPNNVTVDVNTVSRPILLKPKRFIERVFYPASPRNATRPNTTDISQPAEKPIPQPDLVEPGFRIPLLTYDLPLPSGGATTVTDTTVGIEQASIVIEPSGPPPLPTALGSGADVREDVMRVHVSKFAALDLARPDIAKQLYDGGGLDSFTTGSDDQFEPRLSIVLAPILPGRRAVVGTTGTIYTRDRLPDFDPASVVPTFTGADAPEMEFRYVTLASRLGSGQAGEIPGDVQASFDQSSQVSPYNPMRRFEMTPSPDPNKHQFAVRLNGFNDSLTVRLGGRGFNVTAGDGFGPDSYLGDGNGRFDDALNRMATTPVVAIPIDNFSISEPPDQYVSRALELDPDREYDPRVLGAVSAQAPPEGYYASNGVGSGQPRPFDVPFDLLPELVENQTTPNYRSMHLERLANPLLPWNPEPLRPGGEANPQHNTLLPVNPYLPLDSTALDLTAFNSYSRGEANNVGAPQAAATAQSTEFVHIPANGGGGGGANTDYGAENRHRRQRPLPGLGPSGVALLTEIGFASNERGRRVGAFPLLWAFDVPRLLWRQARAAATSELLKLENQIGRVHTVDQNDLATPQNFNATSPYDFSYDTNRLLGPNAGVAEHVVDFPWRMTLGFASRLWGEFYTGGVLRWRDEVGGPASFAGAETVDLDGDGIEADLIGVAEVNSSGAAEFADPDGNGRPNAAELVNTDEEFEQNALVDDSATPELRWPNRPFTSAGELLQVPAWGGSRMLTHFSAFNWQHTQRPGWWHYTQVNPYNGEDGGVGFDHDGLDYTLSNLAGPGTFNNDYGDDFPRANDANNDGFDDASDELRVDVDGVREPGSTNTLRFRETLGHFGHLANFFQTARFPATVGPIARLVDWGQDRARGTADDVIETDIVPRGAAHFYRLLDYVTVPSRFTATTQTLNPVVFGEAGLSPLDPRVELAAPFNQVDRYREPGRVNLNTVVGRNDETELAWRDLNGDQTRQNGEFASVGDWWSEVYDGIMHRDKDENFVNDGGDPSLQYDFYDANGNNQVDDLGQIGHLGPAWRHVALSRRGYVQPTFDPTIDAGLAARNLTNDAQNQVDYSPRRLHPDFPTFFANPFRSPGEGANVPLARMVQTGVDASVLRAHPLSPGADGAWGQRGNDDSVVDKSGDLEPNENGVRDDASEAGILTMTIGGGANAGNLAARLAADAVLARFNDRDPSTGLRGRLPDTFLEDAFRETPNAVDPRDVSPAASTNPGGRPVFNTEISRRATPVPLFSGASLEPSQDTERNATMRYQPIERLANLTTTRSGVFAVWITVGLFEVRPAREDARIYERYMTDTDGDGAGDDFRSDPLRELFFQVYQDGYTLGKELDIETGENRRYRGFYLVDRTRPVAFRPGDDANVDDAILVRRRLQ